MEGDGTTMTAEHRRTTSTTNPKESPGSTKSEPLFEKMGRIKAEDIEDTPAGATKEDENAEESKQTELAPKKPFAFYAIMLALCFAAMSTALEATITSTALPTIIAKLGGADLYIWVVNAYFLTTTATQPLFGQIANIWGRRWPMIFATAAFTLGSGICGGANSMSMLIAGRAVQGIGAGGVTVLIEVIVCDLLPLRDRGKWLGVMFAIVGLGTALGPFFGGLIVQHASWRWVFYLNLPLGGVSVLVLFFFLHVNVDNKSSFVIRLKRVDWTGNLLFTTSMASLLISLSWAGTKYPWSSYRIIVPLIMGFCGFGLFFTYEASRFCVEPTMPIHLFSNRTSVITFILTFLHSFGTIAIIYFLPIYFQGVLGASPDRAGIDLLPTILFLLPFAIIAGGTLSKFGRYRPLHHIGFAFMIIGFGVLSLLEADSSTAEWVIFQLISAAGAGLVLPVLLPAVQATLTEADTALSTSTWAFVRSFGLIWGATIPSAVFNNRCASLSYRVKSTEIAAQLSNGRAYEHATKDFLDSISSNLTRDQVTSVFADALKMVWYVCVAFAGLGFLLVVFEKEIPLRKDLDTQFGLRERERSSRSELPVSEDSAGVDEKEVERGTEEAREV